MKVKENMSFSLYPCCVLVNGKEKDAIYDLQREEYKLIPHSLYYLLTNYKNKTIKYIKTKHKGNEHYINQYLNFLLNNDFGFMCPPGENPLSELRDEISYPKLVINAIFDYDKHSDYSIKDAIEQLDSMHCENLEIRFYDTISFFKLETILGYFKNTTLRDVELLLQYEDSLNLDNLIQLRLAHARMRKITVSGVPKEMEKIYNHQEIYIIFTSEVIKDESVCGVINPWYYLPKTELYIESCHYNNCLNRKISIDRHGEIKNCPSMAISYGNIKDTQLHSVAAREDFQKIWKIKKDDIETCKDCELRYMCQDCRAYLSDPDNIYSKPLKCTYNP